MKRTSSALFSACIGLVIGLQQPTAEAAETNVTIGTAGVTGVYYPAGGAICRLANRGRKEHGIRCGVESTGGSIANLEAIRSGDLDMGVVQSDLLYHAYKGDDVFADRGPNPKLRVLFSLHAEPFTIVARKSAHIEEFDDLKDKRVNIGNPGSGMRATMEALMEKKGWNNKTFAAVVELKASDQAQALCSGKIDAMVFAGGHPNSAIQQVTSACETNLVNVSGPVIDKLVHDNPFFAPATIQGGMYPGNDQNTKTFGVRAVLVASSDLPDNVAYHIVKSVFDNLDNFKTLHPVFATLDAKSMARSVDVAPIHPGAARFFKAKGVVD